MAAGIRSSGGPKLAALLLPLAASCGFAAEGGGASSRQGDLDRDERGRGEAVAEPAHVGSVREVRYELVPPRARGSDTIEISEAGADRIKLRFASLELEAGAEVTIEDSQGNVAHVLREGGEAVWARSVTGDVAIVSIRAGDAEEGRVRAIVDRVAPIELPAGGVTGQSICGNDAKRPAACFEGTIADAARPVGQLTFQSSSGTAACTGALVSPRGHLLTNYHCVSTQEHVDSLEVHFNLQAAWCESDELTDSRTIIGGELVEASFELDYALIRLPENPAEELGYLEIDAGEVAAGREIAIPQHPGGRPKEIAAHDSTIDDTCRVQALDLDVPPYAPGANLGYRCDTEQGSSGSPVVDRHTGELIALHHLGGCENRAISMRDIYPEIEDHLTHGAISP